MSHELQELIDAIKPIEKYCRNKKFTKQQYKNIGEFIGYIISTDKAQQICPLPYILFLKGLHEKGGE